MTIGVDFDEALCLAWWPFEDDRLESLVVLKNRIVRARKLHRCCDCHEQIQPLERSRQMVAIIDGEFGESRWCSRCCAAMAASREDNGAALEARAALGRENWERLQRQEAV